MTNFEKVKEFMTTFGQEVKNKAEFPNEKIVELRKKLIDEDTESFDKIMDAFRLPKKTKEEISFREKKIQQATIGATEVPYKTSLIIIDVIEISISVMKFGNKNSFSDGAVAAELGIASVKSAIMNVKINLNDIKDKKYINSMNKKIFSINEKLKSLTNKISILIEEYLWIISSMYCPQNW